jgi:hypothetical protein
LNKHLVVIAASSVSAIGARQNKNEILRIGKTAFRKPERGAMFIKEATMATRIERAALIG